MHIPDGFIDGTTSAGAGVVAAGGLGAALRRAGQVLDERRVPLAGLVAAFIFAVQMLNFPVASGTSGHLLGGALAAVLVGPSVGAVCVSVVLLVQALLFADGGLSALGLNVLNMALVGAFAAYLLFVGLRRLLPARPGSVAVAAGVAAGLSVVVASAAFAIEYAIGGSGGASVATVVGAMVGVHTLIGIGEGVITALVVSAVLATRPDLVWGARDLELAASPSSSSGPGSGSEVPVAAGEVGP
jgi:cobalt/nickel transport system permease protein